jgi:ATP-binding cassette, subfamily C (CFTR/MRP), member 1
MMQASSDMSILDYDIPYSIAFTLAGFIEVLTTIAAMASVTWQVLIVAIPVLIAVQYVQVNLKK